MSRVNFTDLIISDDDHDYHFPLFLLVGGKLDLDISNKLHKNYENWMHWHTTSPVSSWHYLLYVMNLSPWKYEICRKSSKYQNGSWWLYKSHHIFAKVVTNVIKVNYFIETPMGASPATHVSGMNFSVVSVEGNDSPNASSTWQNQRDNRTTESTRHTVKLPFFSIFIKSVSLIYFCRIMDFKFCLLYVLSGQIQSVSFVPPIEPGY